MSWPYEYRDRFVFLEGRCCLEGWLSSQRIKEETEGLSVIILAIFISPHFESNIYRQTVVSLAQVYVAGPSKGRGDRKGGPRHPGYLCGSLHRSSFTKNSFGFIHLTFFF